MPISSASISASEPLSVAPDRAAMAAELRCSLVEGRSTVTTARAADPLKLLVPRARGSAALVVPTTYGGGLLGGDRIRLEIEVGPDARLCLGTQASTKVYRARAAETTTWEVSARVGTGALLASMPDPVCCFAGARYRQRQRIDLAPGASLAWLDGLTSGRSARDERWAFAAIDARTEIDRGGAPVVRDGLRLRADEGMPVPERFGACDAIATLVLLGPLLAPLATSVLATLAGQPAGGEPLVAASPLAEGAIVRLAARSPAAIGGWLRATLGAALDDLLGHHPWNRKH
jgi:urease accessory protein